MRRSSSHLAILLLSLSVVVRGQGAAPPSEVTPDGAAPLPLASHATRVHLLGTVELYSLALYATPSTMNRPALASEHTPKALRIEITYAEDLRRRVAVDWRRELIPTLESAATTQLRGAFAPLRHGDVVLIEYAPAKGTSVRVNKGVAVAGVSHDLMLAFLEHWLGQRPVSEELKDALLGPS